MQVRILNFEEIKKLNIHEKYLIFSPHSTYYALVDTNIVKSILGVKYARNGIKMQANYTYPEYRRQGLFDYLLRYVLNIYNKEVVYADCLEASKNIYLRNGFVIYKEKEFKHFKIYYMKKE